MLNEHGRAALRARARARRARWRASRSSLARATGDIARRSAGALLPRAQPLLAGRLSGGLRDAERRARALPRHRRRRGRGARAEPAGHHASPAFRLRARARDVRARRCAASATADDRKWQARVISNIGNVEIQLGNHSAALELFDQALELRREIGDDEGAGFDLNNAAFGHIQQALQQRAAGDAMSVPGRGGDGVEAPRPRARASRGSSATSGSRPSACRRWARRTRRCRGPEVALGMADQFLALARESNDKLDRGVRARLHRRAAPPAGRARRGASRSSSGARRHSSRSGSRDEMRARAAHPLAGARGAGNLAEALACLRRAGDDRAAPEERGDRAAVRARWRRGAAWTRRGLETERYKRLAMEDSLTGLANRRQLDERLASLMREARTRGIGGDRGARRRGPFQGHQRPLLPRGGRRGAALRGRDPARALPPGRPRGALRRRGIHAGLPRRSTCARPPRSASASAAPSRAWDWQSIHPQLRVTLSMGLASSTLVRRAAGPARRGRPLALRGQAPRPQPGAAGHPRTPPARSSASPAEKYTSRTSAMVACAAARARWRRSDTRAASSLG